MATHCLFILNCKKYDHKRQRQLESWTQHLPSSVLWFHVVGDPSLTPEYAHVPATHLLTVRCGDGYLALPQKTYLAVKAIRNLFPSVHTILKTDDDMDCDLPAFTDMLKAIEGYDYGGEIIMVERPHMSIYHYPNVAEEDRKPIIMYQCAYCPGRFYFLSRKAADWLLRARPKFDVPGFEDATVGRVMSSNPGLRVLNLDAKKIFHEFS